MFLQIMRKYNYIKNVNNKCTHCGEYVFKESYTYTTLITEMNVINCKKCFIREFGKKFEKTIKGKYNESSKDET